MIKKIIISGGSNSGKTTIIEKIKRLYEIQGIKVIIIEDSIEELLNNNNIEYTDYGYSLEAFTNLVIEKEKQKEQLLDKYLKTQKRDVLVIYSRGPKLNSIYRNSKELSKRTDYDIAINLLGDKSNNTNYERTIDILPKEHLEEKIHEVFNIINRLFGKDEVIRQEKYIVDLTKSRIGEIAAKSRFVKMEQTCLYTDDCKEIRLRRITINGVYYYIYTEYKYVDGKRYLTLEKSISEKEYRLLLKLRNKELQTMTKYRHYIFDKGTWMYVDFFEDKKETGMLEINVINEDDIQIPDYIKVIDRVKEEDNKNNRKLTFKMGDNHDNNIYRSNA